MRRAGSAYSIENNNWILRNYKKYNSYNDFLLAFNIQFGSERSVCAIQKQMSKVLNVRLETTKKLTHFTTKEDSWLIENYNRFGSYKEMTQEFNDIFSSSREITQIREKCTKRLKLKGIISKTAYKKGHEQPQLPIGTIKKINNGCTYIKMMDSHNSNQSGYCEPYWVPIQKKIWEDHNGKTPDKKMIMFLDGNKENIDINNLYCIDRRISAIMASNQWYTSNRENTLAAIKWCELYYSIHKNKER